MSLDSLALPSHAKLIPREKRKFDDAGKPLIIEQPGGVKPDGTGCRSSYDITKNSNEIR